MLAGAAQAQSLSPELSYGTAVPAPAYGGTWTAIAAGTPTPLVTWSDYRGPGGQAYAARVDPFGNLLDAVGLPLSYAYPSVDSPNASFDGTRFLATWGDGRGGIVAARVTRLLVLVMPLLASRRRRASLGARR
jgi:hypothetical protein